MSSIAVSRKCFAVCGRNWFCLPNLCISLILTSSAASICFCRVSLLLCTMSFRASHMSQLTMSIFCINNLVHLCGDLRLAIDSRYCPCVSSHPMCINPSTSALSPIWVWRLKASLMFSGHLLSAVVVLRLQYASRSFVITCAWLQLVVSWSHAISDFVISLYTRITLGALQRTMWVCVSISLHLGQIESFLSRIYVACSLLPQTLRSV